MYVELNSEQTQGTKTYDCNASTYQKPRSWRQRKEKNLGPFWESTSQYLVQINMRAGHTTPTLD